MSEGIFAQCESISEILVISYSLMGIDFVEQFLDQMPGLTKQDFRKAARDFDRVGMVELAQIVRSHARKAKNAPLTFDEKWPPERRRGENTVARMRERGYKV
jgi:hypothetical protein